MLDNAWTFCNHAENINKWSHIIFTHRPICQSVCLTKAVQHPHVMTWHWGSPSSPGWPPPGCNRPPLPPCRPASPFPSPLRPRRAVSVWLNRTFGCQHWLSPRSSPATCAPNPELWYPASCHLEIDTQKQTNYGEWMKEWRRREWRRHTKRTEAERNWQETENPRRQRRTNVYFLARSQQPNSIDSDWNTKK